MPTVSIKKKKYEIKELPFAKYGEVFKAMEALPARFIQFADKGEGEIMANLGTIVGDSMPEFIAIMSKATGIPKYELESVGMSKMLEIVKLTIEVNDYQTVVKELGRFWKNKSFTTPSSTNLPASTDGEKKKSAGSDQVK